MFTGLVEHKGSVIEVTPEGPGARVSVDASGISEGVQLGDSISINGCCLTVVQIEGAALTFQAGEETLARTNLGDLKAGSFVNLERSLRVGDRMGGHFVTGHVDGVGSVDRRLDDEDWSTFWFETPEQLMVEIASKGSITIDGVSLTVVEVTKSQFSVALIPHTLLHTTLGDKNAGDPVNLETDVLAKYVRRQVVAGSDS